MESKRIRKYKMKIGLGEIKSNKKCLQRQKQRITWPVCVIKVIENTVI